MEAKVEVEMGKKLEVREAGDVELRQLYRLFMDIDIQVKKVREVVDEYSEKMDTRFFGYKTLLEKASPILSLSDSSNVEDPRVDMIDWTTKMVDLVMVLEDFIEDLEKALRDLRKLSRHWRSQLGLPKGSDQLYDIITEMLKLADRVEARNLKVKQQT